MDSSMPKSTSKRGAFQPRGDLENRSPEEEDSNDGQFSAGVKVVNKPPPSSRSNPPPLNNNNNSSTSTTAKKKGKCLPVKSSGYGRASPSVGKKMATTMNSLQQQQPQLRHGDGSLPGELSFNRQKTSLRRSTSRSSLMTNTAKSTATGRSNNDNITTAAASSSKKSQSRSASPAIAHRASMSNKRQHLDNNYCYTDGKSTSTGYGGSIVKRQKKQESSFGNSSKSSTVASKSFSSPPGESSNNINNNDDDNNVINNVKTYHAKDFSQNIGIDPTPVKAAKKLLSDAKKRNTAENTATAPLSPLVLSPVMENDGGVARTNDESAAAVKTSTEATIAAAAAAAAAATTSIESMTSIFNDLHPNISQTQSLSDNLFSIQSGIASTSILSLIKKKKPTGTAATAVDKSTPMELRKRLERREDELKTLKIVCNDLLVGKDEFVSGAIGIELSLRQKIMGVKTAYGLMHEEREAVTTQLNDANDEIVKMREEMEGLRRERDLANAKCSSLQDEYDCAKTTIETLQQTNTDNCVKVAILETKVEESQSQLEEARKQVLEAQSFTDIAVAKAKEDLSKDMDIVQEENQALVAKVKARGIEMLRILNVDVESVDLDDGSSILNAIRTKVEEHEHIVNTNSDVKNEVERLTLELKQSKADLGSAMERSVAKDKDFSELMKSVSDIQRTAQEREREVNRLRKVAEDRATEAEKKVLSLDLENQSLGKALDEVKTACLARDNTIQELQTQLSDSKVNSAQFTSQIQLERDLRARSEEKEKEERNERIAISSQMLAMTKEHSKMETQLHDEMKKLDESWEERYAAAMTESVRKDEKLSECREKITSLLAETVSLKQSLSEQKTALDASKEEEIGRLNAEIIVLQERMKSEVEKMQSVGDVSKQRVIELEESIRKSEAERKRMHNIIQELRGNVRVFARIRPFLPHEGDDNVPFVQPSGETTLQIVRGKQECKFQFDRVFAPSAGQDAVFDEVSEFVQSALDGYSVCLFSYGQTGSGKTHTMTGTGSGAMRGLIPRSIEQIGLHKKKLEQEGWEYTMECSFLEIYNEAIRDLLRDSKSNESKHEIKVGADGRRTVTNLTVKRIDPNDTDSIDSVLTRAAKRRSTASTDMNSVSSRSHSVFTLTITAKHEEMNKMISGTLNLVDLAGSERLDRSNATGQTAKEAVAINKSLSSLTDVFAAIGEHSKHVPFRNSKLTYLLQPCFSGDGKTLMVVNISPTEESVQESMCSLRFASSVNKCELGKAKRTFTKVR